MHERHDPGAPDILHRGYAILPSADQNVWEVQVPNDDYTVHIVAGAGQNRLDSIAHDLVIIDQEYVNHVFADAAIGQLNLTIVSLSSARVTVKAIPFRLA